MVSRFRYFKAHFVPGESNHLFKTLLVNILIKTAFKEN